MKTVDDPRKRRLVKANLFGNVSLEAPAVEDRGLEWRRLPHANGLYAYIPYVVKPLANGLHEPVTQLLAEKLRALRGEMSVRELSHATVRVGDLGVGERTIQLLEATPGRVPEADIIEALAAALDVNPEEFYEYPIAAARRTAAATPEATRKREADALRKRAQRPDARPSGEPGTTPDRRRQKGQAP